MLNYPGTSGGKRKDEDLFEDELAQFDRQARGRRPVLPLERSGRSGYPNIE